MVGEYKRNLAIKFPTKHFMDAEGGRREKTEKA